MNIALSAAGVAAFQYRKQDTLLRHTLVTKASEFNHEAQEGCLSQQNAMLTLCSTAPCLHYFVTGIPIDFLFRSR